MERFVEGRLGEKRVAGETFAEERSAHRAELEYLAAVGAERGRSRKQVHEWDAVGGRGRWDAGSGRPEVEVEHECSR